MITMLTHLATQILSITCDNAMANDTMIDYLADTLETFPGSANWTCCFAHILNLVAKCIMQQFDALKNKGNCSGKQDDEDINATLHALAEEMEEMEDENECGEEGEGDSSEENDKLFDGREGM